MQELEKRFDFNAELRTALCKIARNDRKKFTINKFFSRRASLRIYAEALRLGILSVEKSLERPSPKNKRQKAKKTLARDKIQDKIHFNDNFSRFWFYFIEPNLEALKEKRTEETMRLIRQEFDNYASFGFEMLCREFLDKKFGVNLTRSLWVKNIEIDLFAVKGGKIIVGEAKFKEHKMCKNAVNLLLQKCKKLEFAPDYVALFSKSGFSNEINNLKNDRILRFSLNDFEELL